MGQRLNVLMLEDNPGDALLNEEELIDAGLMADCRRVETRDEYLHALDNFDPDVVLADYRLPQFDGLAALRLTRERRPAVPFIIVSGVLDEEAAVELLKSGAADYISKGRIGRLGPAVRNAIALRNAQEESRHAEEELKQSYRDLEQRVLERTRELATANRTLRSREEQLRQDEERLKRSLEATVSTIGKILEIRDPYTAGHERRTSRLAVALAEEMHLPAEKIEGLRIASVLHDVGKMYVPTEILSKPGKLSDLEFSIIKTHPGAGYEILQFIDFPWPVADIIFQHQERYNGSGYPAGLADGEILIEARILAVADVVESMTTARPYRAECGLDMALDEIERNRGILYDPDVVDCCLRIYRENRFENEKVEVF